MSEVNWNILAGLGDSYGKSYAQGQRSATLTARQQALMDPSVRNDDGSLNFNKVGAALASAGDMQGALAVGQLAASQAQQAWQQTYQGTQLGLAVAKNNRDEAAAPAILALRRAQAVQAGTPKLQSGFDKDGNKAMFAPNGQGGLAQVGGAEKQEPSDADKKMTAESETAIKNAKLSLGSLAEADNLLSKSFHGAGATTRATIAANSPLPNVAPFPDPEKGNATLMFNNHMQSQVLSNLKSTFGGNPSNKEGEILSQIQGAKDQPSAVQRDIIRRTREALNETLKLHTERLNQIKAGTFASQPDAASAPTPTSGWGGHPEGTVLKQKGTGKSFIVKGGKPVPYNQNATTGDEGDE